MWLSFGKFPSTIADLYQGDYLKFLCSLGAPTDWIEKIQLKIYDQLRAMLLIVLDGHNEYKKYDYYITLMFTFSIALCFAQSVSQYLLSNGICHPFTAYRQW